jgi:transposase
MTNGIRWVGLDVHAAQTACAVFDSATGEVASRRIMGRPHEVLEWLLALESPVRAVYEAGPTGYGLARRGRAAGIDVRVCAPGMIVRAATERVKTDKRDALKLARLFAAGQLVLVHVPALEHEQLRDLARCREDARGDLMRARHRLSKLLLRHELRFAGRAWSERHRAWLSKIELPERAAQAAFCDYLGAVEALLHRRAELERQIAAAVPDSPWAREVGRLRCLRGVDTLTAVGLCAEIGDFARFARAGQLMSYLGLVPTEHSSGEQRRLGAITRSGSRHARRLLVEAAWHYRNQPRVGVELERRQERQPAEAVAIAWSAQRRLHRVWSRMRRRGKRSTVITVAVARELAGFCWSITQVE